MTTAPAPTAVFAYRAQTRDGQPLTGTLDAPDAAAALAQLTALGLRLIELEPAAAPARARPLRGDEFIAFNQQLAYLTAAGLPVERGLRLIAGDLGRGRLAGAVRQVADELERGRSLAQAFEQHRHLFPPRYGRLVEAGVRTGNLPALLLNLGQHLETVQRLRAAVWRAAAYPLIVLVVLSLVAALIGHFILPAFQAIFDEFNTNLPGLTILLFRSAGFLQVAPLIILGAVVLAPLWWRILRSLGWDQPVLQICVLPLPLIGPILRLNVLSRWCDALRIGVEAGLDLPTALEVAGQTVTTPALADDTSGLIGLVQSGRNLDDLEPHRIVPATVTAALDLAAARNDLPVTLRSLSSMYQQQAELRLGALQGLLTPVLMVVVGGAIGLVIAAVFLPLLHLIGALC